LLKRHRVFPAWIEFKSNKEAGPAGKVEERKKEKTHTPAAIGFLRANFSFHVQAAFNEAFNSTNPRL